MWCIYIPTNLLFLQEIIFFFLFFKVFSIHSLYDICLLLNEHLKSFSRMMGGGGGKHLPPPVPPLPPSVPFLNCLSRPAFFLLTWQCYCLSRPSNFLMTDVTPMPFLNIKKD